MTSAPTSAAVQPMSVCRMRTTASRSPGPPEGQGTSPPTRRCAGAPAAVTTHPQPRPVLPARTRAARENIVFVSGIGCSSRFPYYLTPTACTRSTAARRRSRPGSRRGPSGPVVWVVTGDGDALSIGGNHLIHALRRNVNMTILLFNNRIYGLTKGQYSPTSEPARSPSPRRWGRWTGRSTRCRWRWAPRRRSSPAPSTPTAQAPDRGPARRRRAPRHGAGRDLSELPDLQRRRLRRQVERPTYDDLVRGQLDAAIAAAGAPATDADLAALIAGKDTWTVA
jgi:hypothetical protein